MEQVNARLLGVAALLAVCLAATAGEEDEIVSGCHYSNAEWGTEMIDRCIKENQAIRAQVLSYPQQYKHIVDRCRQGNEYGWGHVKSCVDKDIEAEAALARYPEAKAASIGECRREFAHRGATAVKACVDAAK